MRALRVLLILATWAALWAPAAAAPTFLRYEGKFYQVDFPHDRRVEVPYRLELLVSSLPGGIPHPRGAGQTQAVIRLRDADTHKLLQEFPVVNSYVSADVEFYLGVAGPTSCALLLQHGDFVHLMPRQWEGHTVTGRLLLSNRSHFEQVTGQYHVQRLRP